MEDSSDAADPESESEFTTPPDGSTVPSDSGNNGEALSLNDATVIGKEENPENEKPAAKLRESPVQRMGKYTIGEQIGRGGMGVVWKAFDPDLQRTVAIKVLAEHLAQSATSRRRFQREARAAAAISHANVLTIHSVEEADGMPFLVMEYVSGQSLKQLVAEKGKLDYIQFIHLGCQTAQGLAAAHAQGVIHRDVKPGNVMLDEGATRARLTDFGLARVAFDNQELTSQDQCVGTPSYMSPESLRGDEIDARSDLFSLGCVFYRMLSGYSPFQGRTQGEAVHRILDSTPLRLTDVDPSIPPVLADLVEQLLQKDPDERYQSAAEVADVLSRLQNQVNQTKTDEIDNVLAFARTKPQTTPQPSPLRKKGIAAIAACMICIFAWWLVKDRPWFGSAPVTNVPTAGGGEVASAGVGEDVNSTVTAPQDVSPKLRDITVGSTPDCDCSTIAEAVSRADVGASITVVGPGPFREAVSLQGPSFHGIRLIASPRAIWNCPESNEHRCLSVSDTADVHVEGFDFEVDTQSGRALHLTGDSQNVTIRDCDFRHMLGGHDLSLMLVETSPSDEDSVVTIQDCQFEAEGTNAKCVTFGSGDSTTRVICQDCHFKASDLHIYMEDACHRLILKNNVFVGGNVAVRFGLDVWWPDSHLSIFNNTFVKTRYWLSLGNSFQGTAVPEARTDSQICNNLILGGDRTLGTDDGWEVATTAWDFANNFWERDDFTRSDAGRDGAIAELHDRFDIPEREDAGSAEYLVPAPGSDLLTSGAGGQLPEYVGAKGPAVSTE